MTERTCTIDECGRKTKARGLCGKHYQAWRTANGLVGPAQRVGCSIDGCTSLVRAKGLCGAHYRRVQSHGDPYIKHPPPQNQPRTIGCKADGCNSKHFAKGYCRIHYQRRYHAEHRDEILAKMAARRAMPGTAELARQHAREWREANPEKVKKANKVWRDANRERLKEKRRAYRDGNRETIRALNNGRKALLRGVEPRDLSSKQWLAIVAAYRGMCVYCGIKPERITMDHIVPLSVGGGHTAANVAPACGPCNSKKRAGPVPRMVVQPAMTSRT